MTYVMSDIHGNYSAFQKMLKQINFTDDDLLYIAGDLVDYGADSMELLCDISMRANVYSVVGDHDLEALKMLAGFSKMLESGAAPDAEFANKHALHTRFFIKKRFPLAGATKHYDYWRKGK